ncbi:hypothetical protein [Kiloniella sp.]|uniref:hypothetical protein n=1 Tax=Kiloniella sp. TaxID=1938587 RepID=UPI003B01CCC9
MTAITLILSFSPVNAQDNVDSRVRGVSDCPRTHLREVLSLNAPKDELISNIKVEEENLRLCAHRAKLI